MVHSDWIEHRRGDGELVGWMSPRGEKFVPIDLFGRPLTDAVDWLPAEETLEAVGIGYLADAYELKLDDGHWLRVRVIEVSTERIVVKKDDWGDMSAPQLSYTLPWPIPETLRLLDTSRTRQ
ncbi:MAG: hypothetical protein ABI400_09060 [Lacisediminihabitans sp.]